MFYFSSYWPLSYFILVLSLPWNSRTNNTPLFRHERRSISPEDAAIFDSLECLDASFDVASDPYNGLRPLHQSTPALPMRKSGGSYDHLPPITNSLDEFLTEFDVESNSSNCPSSVLCQSEGFWHQLLRRLDSDPSSTRRTTQSILEPNIVEKIQFSQPAASFGVGNFHLNEVTLATGSASTTQLPSMSQFPYSQKQEFVKFGEPIANRLGHTHSGTSIYSDFSSGQETSSVLGNQHVPLEHQHLFGFDPKASPNSGLSGKMNSRKEEETPTKEMVSTKGTTLKKFNVTTKKASSRKERNSTEAMALWYQNSNSGHALTYNLHCINHRDQKFLEGLLDSEQKMRLSALQEYIQKVWPKANLTGLESLEELKESIEKEFRLREGIPSPFYFLLINEKGTDLETSDHLPFFPWIHILSVYRKCHRQTMLKSAGDMNNYNQNVKMQLLYARAGAQRLSNLGIYAEIDDYLSKMEQSLYQQAKEFGVMQCNLKARVLRILVPAREGTISMLYQADLLLRLSTPSHEHHEHINKEYLLEIMNHTKDVWENLKPFDKTLTNQLHEHSPKRLKRISSLTLMEKLQEIFIKPTGGAPRSMRISRSLLSHWLLDRDHESFTFLNSSGGARISSDFFSFLSDCTVHDLVHMIS